MSKLRKRTARERESPEREPRALKLYPGKPLLLAALLFFPLITLAAQEPTSDVTAVQPQVAAPSIPAPAPQGPCFQTVTEAGFNLEAYEIPGSGGEWGTSEKVALEISVRRGNSLVIRAGVESDFSGKPLSADSVLRELSLSWQAGPAVIAVAGKQSLKWGTARVFSSIAGLTVPLDPLRPAETERGVTGVRLDILPTWWASLSILALPAPALNDSTAALRAEFLVGETDLAFGLIRSVNADGAETPALCADAAHFFERFGIYGEGQLTYTQKWEPALTGGIQVDIPAWLNGTITALAEYRWKPEVSETSSMLYAALSGIPLSNKVTSRLSLLYAPSGGEMVTGGSLYWKIDQTLNAALGYEKQFTGVNGKNAPYPIFTDTANKVYCSVTAYF